MELVGPEKRQQAIEKIKRYGSGAGVPGCGGRQASACATQAEAWPGVLRWWPHAVWRSVRCHERHLLSLYLLLCSEYPDLVLMDCTVPRLSSVV